MKKICAIIVVGFLILILVGTDILAYKTPDEDYSELEQRELAAYPDYSLWSDPAGWINDIDAYLTDHFPFREEIIGQYHSAQAAAGNNVVQELYQLDSDYMFRFVYPTREDHTGLMAKELKAASDKYGVPVVYAMVPLKNTALADSVEGLSNETDLLNRDRTIDALDRNGVMHIDVCGYFLDNFTQEELKDFYYKTDFHWNSKGGYNAGVAIGKGLQELGLIEELPPVSDFQWVDFTYDRSYMGDLQRRISTEPFEGEYIPFYELRNQDGLHYYKEIDGEELDRSKIVACGLEEDVLEYNRISTYNLSFFSVFNDNAKNDKCVLVFKDSYQNMTIDYLTDMFSEVIVMDPRSVKYSFNSVMTCCDVDMILCVYHESNISEELINFLK